MPIFGGGGQIPATVIVGSKSMRVDFTGSPFSVSTTESLGDLSAYSGVSSGAPTSGTVGIWCYVGGPTSLSAAPTLQIGSSSSNYAQVSAVRTFTDAWDLQAGWNYLVFRLVNATTTGTPNWTSVAYVKLTFTAPSNSTLWLDYFTIGKGNVIGLNGLDDRRTTYEVISYSL